jgi:hypothetical protein
MSVGERVARQTQIFPAKPAIALRTLLRLLTVAEFLNVRDLSWIP